MRMLLQYGKRGLSFDIPSEDVTVLAPAYQPGLPDERAAFRDAVRRPVSGRPLKELVKPADRVAIVIPDRTRPLATDRLLEWTLEEIAHVPEVRITIVNGTGTHRGNTPQELASMVGWAVMSRYRVVNHSAYDPAGLAPAGRSLSGMTVRMNRQYVEADRRIVLGFIEPHFMAGFSGGYKGIFPGVADVDSIMEYHGAPIIADPRSTWGVLEGNPTQELIRANGSLLPVDFCINVTQNRERQITGFFCGGVSEAHAEGCRFARDVAMVPCRHPFPIVVTSNSGYPLDQNLYQSVKGMAAAAQIVEPGGFILCASRCDDGFPDHGNFRKLLLDHDSPEAILRTVMTPGFRLCDQWEAQVLAELLLKARIALYSEMDPGEVRRAHLEPVEEPGARIAEELRRIGRDAPIAVLPEGPMAIPYLSGK